MAGGRRQRWPRRRERARAATARRGGCGLAEGACACRSQRAGGRGCQRRWLSSWLCALAAAVRSRLGLRCVASSRGRRCQCSAVGQSGRHECEGVFRSEVSERGWCSCACVLRSWAGECVRACACECTCACVRGCVKSRMRVRADYRRRGGRTMQPVDGGHGKAKMLDRGRIEAGRASGRAGVSMEMRSDRRRRRRRRRKLKLRTRRRLRLGGLLGLKNEPRCGRRDCSRVWSAGGCGRGRGCASGEGVSGSAVGVGEGRQRRESDRESPRESQARQATQVSTVRGGVSEGSQRNGPEIMSMNSVAQSLAVGVPGLSG